MFAHSSPEYQLLSTTIKYLRNKVKNWPKLLVVWRNIEIVRMFIFGVNIWCVILLRSLTFLYS